MTQVWDGGVPDTRPSINLVIVEPESTRDDQYGRQIRRVTSVVHLDNQSAGANCWLQPDDGRATQWDGVRHIVAAGIEREVPAAHES